MNVLSMVLFEIDLNTRQMVFPQPGFLEGAVQAGQFYEHDAFLKRLVEELVHPEDREAVWKACQVSNHFSQTGRPQCEFRLKPPGQDGYQWVFLSEMSGHDKQRAIGTIENITEQKRREDALRFQAEHDALTGLMNRGAFRSAMDELTRETKSGGLYVFLDIDNFKRVNDTRGHRYGDWLLGRVSEALRAVLPRNALLGRYGGDEFMIYIPGVEGRAQAGRQAQTILDVIGRIQTEDGPLTSCVGAALFPQHGDSWDHGLAECADVAMYQAKAGGKCRYCVYDVSLKRTLTAEKRNGGRSWRGRFSVWLQGNRGYAARLLTSGVLLLAVLIVLTGVYTRNLRDLVDEESQDYLEEISAQMNLSLVRGMTSNYANLSSMATKMAQVRDWPLSDILADLNHEAGIFDYEQMALIDRDGEWVTEDGTHTFSELFPYITQMKRAEKPVTTPILSLFGEDCVVFLHPLPDVTIGGGEYIGVAAMADMDTLNKMLNLELFDGAGYAHVVTRQGSVVIRANHEDNQFFGYNLFKHLETADFDGEVTLDTLTGDFAAGSSRRIRYKLGDRDLMSIYVPVEYEDWYLFTVIPSSVLTAKTGSFYTLTMLACGVIAALFLLLVAVIFLLLMRGRQRLVDQLDTDPVTGGLSKAKFGRLAGDALRGTGSYSILYANIGRFKLVNERDGSGQGDELLRRVHAVIEQELDDGELIGRLMADHFGILAATRDMGFLRRRIGDWNQHIQEQLALLKITTPVSVNYGVLPVTDPTEAVSTMLDKANLARKTAPAGSVIGLYDEALAERQRLETELEQRQEQALRDGEFVAYFQPKYSPRTEQIVGAEALVRWITPDRGMISPGQFIPLFESNGFISRLDLSIFEQACRFIRTLGEAGMEPIPISVNLSRFNLGNPDFLQDYVRVWSQYHFDAALLEFEITETLVYENMERLSKLLESIHQAGFRVSMDDFGNGYSSLNMLKGVDIDVLKLDRDFFTADESQSDRALVIVKRLIELAKDLGMQVVAEGVETRKIVEFLRRQDCDMIQGFYYSRPVPEDVLWERLKKEEETS